MFPSLPRELEKAITGGGGGKKFLVSRRKRTRRRIQREAGPNQEAEKRRQKTVDGKLKSFQRERCEE